MKNNISIFLIILFCATVSTFNFIRIGMQPCTDCIYVASTLSNDVIDGTASFPYIYRVLTPYILWIMGGGLIHIALFHLVMRSLMLILLYTWVERWGGSGIASVGLMTVALSVMNITWYESHYALTESVLLLISWLLLIKSQLDFKHYLLFSFLIVLGFLNREMTGVLLLLSWLALHGMRWKLSLLYIAVGVTVFVLLRVIIGDVSQSYSWADVLHSNIHTWRLNGAIIYNIMLFPLWLGLLFQSRRMPTQYKRLILILIPYGVLFLTYARWQEVRLLMPFAFMAFPLLRESVKDGIRS